MESQKIILKPGDLIEKSEKVLVRRKDGRPTNKWTWKTKVGFILRIEEKQVQSYVKNTYEYAYVVIRFPGEKNDVRMLYGSVLEMIKFGWSDSKGNKMENPWKHHPAKKIH